MPPLYDAQAKAVPAEFLAITQACTTMMTELEKELHDTLWLLQRQKLDETSFGVPNAQSTQVNMTGTVAGSMLGSSGSSYNYRKDDMWEFDGNPVHYPAWKNEMVTGFLLGKPEQQAIKLIAKLSPKKNLALMFDKVEEAWHEMDVAYANHDVVAELSLIHI